MILGHAPLVLVATLFLTAPGLIWAWRSFPSSSWVLRLVVGLALGIAIQIHVAALLSAGPGINRSNVLISTLLEISAASVVAWRVPGSRTRSPEAALHRRDTALVALVVLAVAAIRLAPLAVAEIPPGFDSSFHALLASTTVAGGHLPTWRPFEPIQSNYPYGGQVLVAAVSLLTGVGPDAVFSVLLDGVVAVASVLATYAFADVAFRNHRIALGAAAAYGLTASWGSIDYGLWGGLPNALGFCFFLVAMALLFDTATGVTGLVVGGLLLGAVGLIHHHVTVTVGALLAAYLLYLAGAAFLRRDQQGRARARSAVRRLGLMTIIASASVAYYVVPLALRAGSLGGTGILTFSEQVPDPFFGLNGFFLWLLAGGGVIVLLPVSRRLGFRPSGDGPALAFIAVSAGVLMVLFWAGFYLYGDYTLSRFGQRFSFFTAGRFLTDETYFLALYAGVGLTFAWSATRSRPLLVAVRLVLVLAIVLTAAKYASTQMLYADVTLAPGESRALAWIKGNTAPDSLVINLDPHGGWVPYLSQREVAYTPLPTSEAVAGYPTDKRRWADHLQESLGLRPSQGVAEESALRFSPGTRPVLVVLDQDLPSLQLLFQAGEVRVYLVSGNPRT